jgi:hypothetical protein
MLCCRAKNSTSFMLCSFLYPPPPAAATDALAVLVRKGASTHTPGGARLFVFCLEPHTLAVPRVAPPVPAPPAPANPDGGDSPAAQQHTKAISPLKAKLRGATRAAGMLTAVGMLMPVHICMSVSCASPAVRRRPPLPVTGSGDLDRRRPRVCCRGLRGENPPRSAGGLRQTTILRWCGYGGCGGRGRRSSCPCNTAGGGGSGLSGRGRGAVGTLAQHPGRRFRDMPHSNLCGMCRRFLLDTVPCVDIVPSRRFLSPDRLTAALHPPLHSAGVNRNTILVCRCALPRVRAQEQLPRLG